MRQPAVCLALLLVLLCGAEAKKPAPQSKKSNVCLRNLYEVQYRVQNNRYVDKFAPVILARVQRDILQELRQRKVVGLCAPVSVRLLKGCFHAYKQKGKKVSLGIFQFAYKTHYKCKNGTHKFFRITSHAIVNRHGKVLRGKARIKLIPRSRY